MNIPCTGVSTCLFAGVVSRSNLFSHSLVFPVSVNAHRLYPDLVARSIRENCYVFDRVSLAYAYEFAESVIEESWENLELCAAWLETTNRWLDNFPETHMSNPDFGLLVAEHACTMFWKLAAELRENKEFVLRAIQVNPRNYLGLSDECKQDQDIILASFGHAHAIDDIIGDESFIVRPGVHSALLCEKRAAAAKVRAYQGFVEGFLPGFEAFNGQCRSTTSCVALIDNDPDSTMSHLKMIAGFVGVPSFSEMESLQRLVNNLQFL